MDVAPLLPQNNAHNEGKEKSYRSVARGRGRRCILVATVLAVATLIYFCGVALPLVGDTDYHSITGFNHAPETTDATVSSEELEGTLESPAKLGEDAVNISNSNHSGFVLNTPGCRIPDLPARNALIMKYIKDLEPKPKCEELSAPLYGKKKQKGPPLVQSNLTSMWVVKSALPYYNITDMRFVACCYRPFSRIQENTDTYGFKADSHYKYSKQCFPFAGDSVSVDAEEHEYVRVECSRVTWEISDVNSTEGNETTTASPTSETKKPQQEIYRDFHAFIPIKRHVEERCMKYPHNANEVSVVLLGIDAVSRLNMLRELPLLHNVLTSPPLSAISLLGYNKVGDNTFPNVMPILTGLAEDELRDACPWPSARHKLDPCPFIWKQFADRGYRTACGEDATWMTSFNYAKTGFVNVPTDYYSRPFLQAAENEQGHSKRWNVKLCVGPRLALTNIIDYVRKYSLRFANERHFGFFWTNSVSHDFLNMPHNGDLLYSSLLQNLSTSGALDRTVLIVLSDHGIRWGGIRETYQGRMEERLPFLYISFPRWFHQQFPSAVANVRRNARNRLTTPFDIHATLQDLLDPSSKLGPDVLRSRELKMLPKNNSNVKQKSNVTKEIANKGISLFLPIPVSRNCRSANIPPHFCTCQESVPVPVDDSIIENAVKFVISEINLWLAQYRQCAQLRLENIRSAQRNLPLEEVRTDHASIVDYLVTFVTQPGEGVFEATVRETPQSTSNSSANFDLAGSVSRINRYGEQSRCVADYHMKLYCFCT